VRGVEGGSLVVSTDGRGGRGCGWEAGETGALPNGVGGIGAPSCGTTIPFAYAYCASSPPAEAPPVEASSSSPSPSKLVGEGTEIERAASRLLRFERIVCGAFFDRRRCSLDALRAILTSSRCCRTSCIGTPSERENELSHEDNSRCQSLFAC
jgi:hypothetical protein